MEIFPLNEFVNGLNLSNVNNDNSKKIVIKKILTALNNICPGSYLPYLFMYAAATKNLHFKPLAGEGEVATGEGINQEVPYAQTVNKNGFFYFLSKEDNIFKKASEELEVKTSKSSTLLGRGLSDLLKLIEDEDRVVYCWYFSDITCLVTLENLKKYDVFFKRYEKNIYYNDNYESYSDFVETSNKISYYALIGILNACLPLNPDLDDTTMAEESYFSSKEDWLAFFDQLIIDQYKSHDPQYNTLPEGFTRIVNGLLEDGENAVLFNPYNNLGEFALNINAQMSTPRELKVPVCYITIDKDPIAVSATAVRLLFHDCMSGYLKEGESEKTNAILNGTTKSNVDGTKSRFNMVTMPPYINKVNVNGKDVNPVEDAIQRGLIIANNGGKSVCIVPSSVMVSRRFRDIRKQIVDSKYATKFVMMPQGSLGFTSLATTIILIDGTKESDTLKFIDGSFYVEIKGKDIQIDYIAISNLCYHNDFPAFEKFGSFNYHFGPSVWTPNEENFHEEWDDQYDVNLTRDSFKHNIKITLKEEIRQNDYSLNPSFYFDHTVLAPEGYETRNLADILVKEVEVVDDNGQGKIVSARDLHANDSLIELDPEKLTTKKVSNPGGTLIYKVGIGSYLIVSRVGNLSPTAIKVTDTIYVNRNSVEVYKIVDDTIDPAYLANEMRKNYFSDQLHYTKMVSGMTNQLVLSVLNVFVPKTTETRSSLQLQKDAVEKDMLDKMCIIGEQLKRSNDERFNEYEKELHQRKHRLSQYLDNVGPALDNLRNAFAKHNGILKTSDIVSRKSGLSVDQYLEMMQDSVEKMSSLIGHLTDRNHWGTPERIDIENFVTEFTEKHIHVNYKFQVVIDEASVMEAGENVEDSGHIIVKMPKDELTVVFENIVANAETWGFTDSTREDYIIKISLGIKDGDKVMLSISNNGTPIDPKTDLENLFEWGFGNHTGIGTNDARNIVRHYDGNIAIFTHPNAEDGFETEYVITIPMEI